MNLSFQLNKDFVNSYRDKPEFPGNPLGAVTFYRTYSRKKEDGSYESWTDVCERVINGMYSIQKDYCKKHKRKWSDNKAQASAQEAFSRLFDLKWSPPGRGLYTMGSPTVHERMLVEAVNNCAFTSTENLKTELGNIFSWFMNMLMLGVGVGFDTDGKNSVFIRTPLVYDDTPIIIEDSREGWANSVKTLFESYIAESYLIDYSNYGVTFDYSLIRPEGSEIKGFGGTASGSGPLMKLHDRMRQILDANSEHEITTKTIVDIFNVIGACVVAGNVRRSSELALGYPNDQEFYQLKDYTQFPDRQEWGWASNNSVYADLGMDYSEFASQIHQTGEPGFVWMENTHNFKRMNGIQENGDHDAKGYNPCAEQPLESREMCTLTELYPTRHEDLYDFLRSVKFAYLYAKTITLLSDQIHDKQTRYIMRKNRRIGLSMTGIAQFITSHTIGELIEWAETSYKYVEHYDEHYSGWFGVNKSNRKTTVKPSGTISLLAGVTPGVHYPRSEYYIRRIRISELSPIVPVLAESGFRVEKDLYSDNTIVVEFPVHIGNGIRSVLDVSIWEQMAIASIMQRHWSDNSVSVTVSFDPQKVTPKELAYALDIYQWQLKTVSLLPEPDGGAYAQMPYEPITQEQYDVAIAKIDSTRLNSLAQAMSDVSKLTDKFCNNDVCEIKFETAQLAS